MFYISVSAAVYDVLLGVPAPRAADGQQESFTAGF